MEDSKLVADSKVGKVLNGNLLPKVNNDHLAFLQLDNIYSTTITDDNGKCGCDNYKLI